MILVLDNNIFFSLMKTNSVNSYLFSLIRAKFLAPEFLKSELREHKEECLIKSKLSEQEFEIRQKEVEESVEFIKLSEYKKFLKESINVLSDLDDVPYLAVALSTNAIIWSNDLRLKQQSLIEVFTTKDLLKMFLKGEI